MSEPKMSGNSKYLKMYLNRYHLILKTFKLKGDSNESNKYFS